MRRSSSRFPLERKTQLFGQPPEEGRLLPSLPLCRPDRLLGHRLTLSRADGTEDHRLTALQTKHSDAIATEQVFAASTLLGCAASGMI